ncbi:hypothetical protein QFZ66_005566 [Streptomyces sp. B4I13]|uniref:hypothetical protein n=1 Tax=Streptomyces sp. B4I13 TaxID=3042271 RepID=UPI0027827AB1|nr:hypothetical protein [Streptomyces sp. B4I13]MDQ0961688.1 hypothetical protein [Streptomyces sp. B4I13]
MKSLKAAVVVAGSVILAGVAAPAFATPADLTPTSLNGAVDTLARGPINVQDALPLQHQSDALDTENKDSALHAVNGAAEALNTHNPLLGGVPLQG